MPTVLRATLPFIVAVLIATAGFALLAAAHGAVGSVLQDPDNGHMGDWLLGAAQPGHWLIAVGLLLAGVAAMRLANRGGLARVGPWIGGGGAVVLALTTLHGLAFSGKCFDIPGVGPVWSLDDDMMVTLRYARNLASGVGLVWNPGERVEGITNFLWALVLVVPHWFLAPERVAAAVIVLNGLLLAAAIGLTFRLVRQLGGSRVAATLAVFALATHQATLHWTAGGSEALLLAVLLLVLAGLAAKDEVSARQRLWAGLLGGLAILTRPDAAPAALILVLGVTLRAGKRSEWLKGVGAFLLLPLLQLLFRLGYYGAPLPNTYYLKMTGWDGRSLAGIEYLLRLLSQHGLHVAAACAALLAVRRRAAALVLVALFAHLLYLVHAGGDELPKQRFFVPVAPFLFALSMVGAEQLAHRIGGATGPVSECTSRSCQPLYLPVAVLSLAGLGGALVPGVTDPGGVYRARAEKANVMVGYLLRTNTEPDARIAHFWAGAAAYFSERRGIDLLGKCDPVIARQRARPGIMKPGHNKYDFNHSLAFEPDVIVGGVWGLINLEQVKQYQAESPYRAFADLYDAPLFRANYVAFADPRASADPRQMTTLIGAAGTQLPRDFADVSLSFHGIFVRRTTTKAKPAAEWVAPR